MATGTRDHGPLSPCAGGIDAEPSRPRSFAARTRHANAPPQRTQVRQPAAVETVQGLIDGLPERIALLDSSWTILTVNRAWEDASRKSATDHFPLGSNYLEICERRADRGDKEAEVIAVALRQIMAGKRKSFRHVHLEPDKRGGRQFQLTITAFKSGSDQFATITLFDVTDLTELASEGRALEDRLIRVQQEERRRIGRELHDATSQYLVVLHLGLIRLKGMYSDEASKPLFSEIDEALAKINDEIRAISYLLHPPSLDAGLVAALDEMARGFGRRTGLQIGFWFDGERRHWAPGTQGTLYRLAQEALANVHRHAHANQVGIRLVARGSGLLHLLIEDDGCGIPPGAIQSLAPLGVGIASMRARVRELGGRLSIRRMTTGTCVIASVPHSLESRGRR